MLDISLVILGAGNSSRFKCKTKKQWLFIGNQPLWLRVAENINSYYNFKQIVVVASKEELFYMKKFSDYTVTEGGHTREQSLKNALLHVKTKYVMVHDVARANVSKDLILKLVDNIDDFDCIVPYIEVCDTATYAEDMIDRNKIRLIQTPQLSIVSSLKKSLEANNNFTDDSSAIKSNGGKVKYILGDKKTQKITFIDDLKSILKYFKKPTNQTFVGFGYDVHQYEHNKEMLLGGVRVCDNMGFKAHSDGDVLSHAIIDSLLGAIGAGDIGEWFPDTCKNYQNANSLELLKEVSNFITRVGFRINNIDVSIVAEFPKISPFKDEISKKLATILDIPKYHINIKATTSETMGFIGRKEGLAVYAIASLKYFDWTKHECINS